MLAPASKSEIGNRKSEIGFTLVELLVVISIIGIMAALTVPALKNMGKSNIAVSASRQMLDDVGHARQLAISQHTTVYMVFVPTNFFLLKNVYGGDLMADLNNAARIPLAADRDMALKTATNLIAEQLTGYTFVSYGKVGDQPGQHTYHYLASWQSLPEGTFIPPQKFARPGGSPGAYYDIPQWETDFAGQLDNSWRTLQVGIYCFTNISLPFPTEQSPPVLLPVIAFNHLGQLISETPDGNNLHHAYIPLAQGSVGYQLDVATKTPLPNLVNASDITENPPGNSSNISYNIIDIDPLTGRASQQFFKIK